MPAWLESAAPGQLAVFLIQQASQRKRGLFIRHLCRCFPQIFTDPLILAALDAADQHEAGEIDDDAFNSAIVTASVAANTAQDESVAGPTDVRSRAAARGAEIAREVLRHGYFRSFLSELRRAVLEHAGGRTPPRKNPIAPVMRPVFFEHFGDPRTPVNRDPAWLTSTVVQLARGIYDDRAFDRMPILADALQDAGCENADVLGHCRGRREGVPGEPTGGSPAPATHVRGCWVVDLLLGKE